MKNIRMDQHYYEQKRKLFETNALKGKTLLIVGNGFTKSFLNHSNISIDSSKPFTGFGLNDEYFDKILTKIPDIKDIIKSYSGYDDDFDILSKFLKDYRDDARIMCYMKRFITLAYSRFQIEIEKNDLIESWTFTKWLRENKSKISSIYCLNYDLILENVLKIAEVDYCRPFTTEHRSNKNYRCYLYKPHGSIDFDLPKQFGFIDEESLWTAIIRDNIVQIGNLNLQIIDKNDLLKPRLQQDIVLPSSENDQMKLSWVKNIYSHIFSRVNSVGRVIIFGFGYREEDRLEFNHILNSIDNKKPIMFYHIGYKYKNDDLENVIINHRHKYEFLDTEKCDLEKILNFL